MASMTATQESRKVGRKSLGPRHMIGSRISPDLAKKLEVVARAHGTTVSDFVGALIAERLEGEDMEAARYSGQQPLPLEEAMLPRTA